MLFICLHGSAKSVIAAEHFRRLAVQRRLDVRAASAGIEPDCEIPPKVVHGLLEDGIDVRGRRPRPVTHEELANVSHVITFSCDLPVGAAGLYVERWDDVPAVSQDFKKARDAIVARLMRLLDKWDV